MRTTIVAGHIFYYLRKELSDILPQINPEYKRIDDFGIVPITFINGYYPKAHEHFMRDLKKNDLIDPNKIRHVVFQNGLPNIVESTGVLWYLQADSICQNVFDATLLMADPGINISKFKIADIFYMERYADLYADYIEEFEKANMPSIDFIVKNLGKEYEFLYDVLYDALEVIYWHGSATHLKSLHFYLDKLMNEEIIAKLPEAASFYWRRNPILYTQLTSNFIQGLVNNEKEELEKAKKQEVKKLKKKIIRR